MSSPTARTLARLRKDEIAADVVERWIPQARKRKDVADCIDVIAYDERVGVLGIQTTSGTNHAHRRVKALGSERLARWLRAGGRFELWSWSKVKNRWTLRREAITLAEVANASIRHQDGGAASGGHGARVEVVIPVGEGTRTTERD